jgi:enoyl-CoA hydratase/carnithine racemase
MDIEVREDFGGRLRTLVFNRPAKKNALTVAMYATLADEIAAAGSSGEVRALVITGAGNVFTAGNDIMDFVAQPPVNDDSHVVRFLKALVAFPKPIVAAVNGPAIGVGSTMLLHCDLVLAVSSARFQLPFVKLGLCPEGGSSLLLPRMAGLQRASEVLLWGEPFDAPTAERLGFVNEICAEGALEASTRARIERLLELPPEAVAAAKELVRAPLRAELAETMAREASAFQKRLASSEAAEAFAAFLEKRKPRFAGGSG